MEFVVGSVSIVVVILGFLSRKSELQLFFLHRSSPSHPQKMEFIHQNKMLVFSSTGKKHLNLKSLNLNLISFYTPKWTRKNLYSKRPVFIQIIRGLLVLLVRLVMFCWLLFIYLLCNYGLFFSLVFFGSCSDIFFITTPDENTHESCSTNVSVITVSVPERSLTPGQICNPLNNESRRSPSTLQKTSEGFSCFEWQKSSRYFHNT